MAGITGMDHYLIPDNIGPSKILGIIIAALIIFGAMWYLTSKLRKKSKKRK